MSNRAILRLVQKKITKYRDLDLEYSGLLGKETWTIKEYIVEPDYLVLQRLDQPDAFKGVDKRIRLAPLPWRPYCRWHDGPLWQKDEPWKRLYCVVQTDSYCRQHKRSIRALYELCISTHSHNSLEICKKIDSMGRTNYVVYLTDAGAGRVKVGVTREFRFYERLAEQAHNIATVLHVVDSLYEARKLELQISKKNLASQVKSRRPKKVYLPKVVALISNAAERISKTVGIEWSGELVRVVSSKQRVVLEMPEAKPENIAGKTFTITGYWGGHLILEDEGAGRLLHISDRRLLHTDPLLLDY